MCYARLYIIEAKERENSNEESDHSGKSSKGKPESVCSVLQSDHH